MATIRHFWVTQLVIEQDYLVDDEVVGKELSETIERHIARTKEILNMAFRNTSFRWYLHGDIQRVWPVKED